MTIREMQALLDATLLFGEDSLDSEIQTVFSADMMSDLLAYGKFGHACSILLTGLCNPQVIRTAEMLDIHCIVFVRGKVPAEDVLSLGRDRNIAMFTTRRHMFTSCGLLYQEGLRGGE